MMSSKGKFSKKIKWSETAEGETEFSQNTILGNLNMETFENTLYMYVIKRTTNSILGTLVFMSIFYYVNIRLLPIFNNLKVTHFQREDKNLPKLDKFQKITIDT